jgi:hypothetical protein
MFWRGRSPWLAIALGVAVWAPAHASAAGSSTAAASSPPVAARAASAVLYLPDAFFVDHRPVTVPGRVFHVFGVVRPYIPGQWVTVRTFLGHRLIKTDRLRLKPSPGRGYGRFRESVTSPGSGQISVSVVHGATPQMRALQVRRGLDALAANASFGSSGQFVKLIQQRLAALHVYIPQTGVYDQGTGLAIDAYHRLLHWGTSQNLDGRTISYLLDGFGSFRVRFPGHGRHAEGNLSLQVVALVDGSQVQRIYPISSGKPSTPTILGDYQVYSRVPGYLPDGMYYSDFFTRGYAIHGYDPAPDYPASHGCMRLPIVDAISVFDWLALGDWVDVYY